MLIRLSFIALLGLASSLAANSKEVSFNFEIRPILSKNCIGCHGPDPGDRKADLRLDTFEGATSTEFGDASIVPGDPDASLMIQRIESNDPDEVMPPPEHGHSLNKEELALLKQWIREGGHYETHWAFVPPTRPAAPEATTTDWGKNEIDSFILAALEQNNLRPSAPAKASELLRRLSLDLTGLPPSWEESKDFQKSYHENSAQAVSEAVDRLLASPAYGEHWASMWMDLARYADTVGYSGDEHRDIWPWRDWVIKAFNDNMPYDQFITEQVAGDLLPEADEYQRLATAFHRLTLNNNEGGTNDEEFRTIAVKDRLSTTVNATMGLTIRCAECHTHKYDPITIQEYYEFYAFFNQSADRDHRDDRPRMAVTPPGTEKERKVLKNRITQIKQAAEQTSPWTALSLDQSTATNGVTFSPKPDRSILAGGSNPPNATYTLRAPAPAETTTALQLELIPDLRHNDMIGRSPSGSVFLNHIQLFVVTPDGQRERRYFSHATADYSQPNYSITNIIGEEAHRNGWAMNHPKQGFKARRIAVFDLDKPIDAPRGSTLEVELHFQSSLPRVTAGRIRLSVTSAPQAASRFEKRTLHPLGRELVEMQDTLNATIRVPVTVELPQKRQRETHIMTRGSFLQLGEKVAASLPAAFGELPNDAPKNRLGVAQWITADTNPLTARVAANRYWARLFGIGIVETEEDFGTQGTLPSHPELLDWLAVELQEGGWDIKKFLKTLVTSAAYQQSSQASPERLERDPRNTLLSRGPRYRLSAEVVRDQALAVSGLLNQELYGPPVYPPSPIKKFANAFTGYTHWVESQGTDRYRRALYTYLKRSNPHPLFETFDMASRDVCVMRRFRTNTPLQSFMTLNDVVFVEASQALARKMKSHSDTVEEQIRHGLRLVLLDEPISDQVTILSELYEKSLHEYENDLTSALELAGTIPTPATDENAAQLASLTVVANILLNLDAFLCK